MARTKHTHQKRTVPVPPRKLRPAASGTIHRLRRTRRVPRACERIRISREARQLIERLALCIAENILELVTTAPASPVEIFPTVLYRVCTPQGESALKRTEHSLHRSAQSDT